MGGYNFNSGYVGSKRSRRSLNAINSYEVPISMIKKELIINFLKTYKEGFTEEELVYLHSVSITKWKFIAKEYVSSTSWHHTSSFFNETNHYKLLDVAHKLIKMQDTIDKKFKESKEEQKQEQSDFKFGVIKVEVWGGTKKYPRVIGYEQVAGIIIGDWLYYKENNEINNSIKKYKTNANKVKMLRVYDSYVELTKEFEIYEDMEEVFERIIEEKKLK